MSRPLPSRERLLEQFAYVPADGSVFSAKNGKAAGYVNNRGYLTLWCDGQAWQGHRLIYKMAHGVDPGDLFVDHIDGNRSNNALDNLQLVNNQQNQHKSKVCNNNPKTINGKHTEHGKASRRKNCT